MTAHGKKTSRQTKSATPKFYVIYFFYRILRGSRESALSMFFSFVFSPFIIKHNNHDYVISVLTNKNINKKRDVSITFFEVEKEDKLKLHEINNYLYRNSPYSEYIYTLDGNLLILVDYEI